MDTPLEHTEHRLAFYRAQRNAYLSKAWELSRVGGLDLQQRANIEKSLAWADSYIYELEQLLKTFEDNTTAEDLEELADEEEQEAEEPYCLEPYYMLEAVSFGFANLAEANELRFLPAEELEILADTQSQLIRLNGYAVNKLFKQMSAKIDFDAEQKALQNATETK